MEENNQETNSCIFCKISKGDINSERIYENNAFFSVYDLNQNIPGHALVISKEHYGDISEVPTDKGNELLDCINKTSQKIISKYSSEAFNVLGNNGRVSGQIINHFHVHILPRKESDGLKVIC